MSKNKMVVNSKLKIGALITMSSLIMILAAFYVIGEKSVVDKVHMEWISHTEYWSGDNASTIIRLTDYKGEPYYPDECTVSILYPNKTYFVVNSSLVRSTINGNMYRTDSLIGAPLGTYEQEVTCVFGDQLVSSSESFHLNPALVGIKTLIDSSLFLNKSLIEMGLSIDATLKESNNTLSLSINELNTSIGELMGVLNSSIPTEDILSSLNASLDAMVEETGDIIHLEMMHINQSFRDFLNSFSIEILGQINGSLGDLAGDIGQVQEDLDWLVANAMNLNHTEIDHRFDNIDLILQNISTKCDNVESCVNLTSLEDAVAILRIEQNLYLGQINETTTNIWSQMIGDYTVNMNQLIGSVGSLILRTDEINGTTHEILNQIQGEVRISVIS